MPQPPTRRDCLALDALSPLHRLREQFSLPEGLIYLDGNSLGVLPAATPARVAQVVNQEWGEGLIGSWNHAGWIDLPLQVGNQIARLIGAGPGEVVATDSTSINLYKVLHAALRLAQRRDPRRTRIVSERSNFPTDLYIAHSLAAQHGGVLELVDEASALPERLGDDTAVLLLTEVNYRTGARHDMAALTAAAHAAGALTVWDLAHSAGAVPVNLHAADADFAVGCGYKYLNGGPGAPAFAWVHPRHADATQPLSGWMGHAAPFAFETRYSPAPGIRRYVCGTPNVIGLAALACGVDTVLAAEPLGGMAALHAQSIALSEQFIADVEHRCAGHGLRLVSPRSPNERGSQVCFTLDGEDPGQGYAVMQALIARGVVGDFRAGDPPILRFGFTPLYIGHSDVYDAVSHLHAVFTEREHALPQHQQRHAVT